MCCVTKPGWHGKRGFILLLHFVVYIYFFAWPATSPSLKFPSLPLVCNSVVQKISKKRFSLNLPSNHLLNVFPSSSLTAFTPFCLNNADTWSHNWSFYAAGYNLVSPSNDPSSFNPSIPHPKHRRWLHFCIV